MSHTGETETREAPFVYPKPKVTLEKGKTPFWGKEPNVILQPNRLLYFFPNEKMSMIENLNSLVRLSLYLAIFLILYTRNVRYLFLFLGTLFITYLVFTYSPMKEKLFLPVATTRLQKAQQAIDKKNEQLERVCVGPTVDNPFMNFNYITDSYKRPPGCKAFLYDDKQSAKIKKQVKDSFNYNLYRDVSDLYGKNNSQREFFTMPWTSWPNDQTSFAKWLYGIQSSCKENSVKCAPYWNPSASYSLLEN